MCCRPVSMEHQGKLDSQRHCLGKSNIPMVNAKRFQGHTDAQFVTLDSNVGKEPKIADGKLN